MSYLKDKMKCIYCDCVKDSEGKVNGFDFCSDHIKELKYVKITDRDLGHQSVYKCEDVESVFDFFRERSLRPLDSNFKGEE